MGFLKFLKREKKEALDELDLPPAPPPLEGFEDMELPEFPEFPEEKISAPQASFDFEKEEMPELKEELKIPEMEEKPVQAVKTPIAAPMPTISAPQITPEIAQEPEQTKQPIAPEEPRFTPLDAYPKMERGLFAQEKRIMREKPTAKTIYVRVDEFKATLGSINMVRSDLRKSEEALMKLENIKHSKDKAFDNVRASLDDLQKKLIFIDKTLFEGE